MCLCGNLCMCNAGVSHEQNIGQNGVRGSLNIADVTCRSNFLYNVVRHVLCAYRTHNSRDTVRFSVKYSFF
jgi:hypothetical protein